MHLGTIVLVPGSWHYGELFADVAAHLEFRGYEVYTPTVAGHGPGADPNVTHADAVDSIEDFIVDHDLNDIILVGHSFGGTILTQVAPRIVDRLKRVVFHNAFVVADGHSIYDEVPPEYVAMFEAIKDPETGTVMLPEQAWRDNFIQDATARHAHAIYKKLTPEPASMINTPLDQKAFFELVKNQTVPMSYLTFDGDIALPHGQWEWYPRFGNRLGFPRVIRVPEGSHEIMFTNPRLLAKKIIEAGRD